MNIIRRHFPNIMPEHILPKRWVHLKKALERDEWKLNRISGSHHIFVKPGHRCIPVAFHGGTISPRYARLVLRQAGLDAQEYGILDVSSLEVEESIVTKDAEGTFIQTKQKIFFCQESKPMTKVDVSESIRKEREIEHCGQVFKKIGLERQKEFQRLDGQRNKLLEDIQGLIASKEYNQALEMMSDTEMEEFGSSSELYEFNCNILFYRVVALGEFALSSLGFNSAEQQQSLNQALDFAATAIKCSLESRSAVRDLAKKLQQRITTRYLEGLIQVHNAYICKEYPSEGEEKASKSEIYSLMDDVVKGFEFIVSISDRCEIPFCEDVLDVCNRTQLVSLADVCVRKMLISFDTSEFDKALRLSETISTLAQGNKDAINLHHHAIRCFFPPYTWRTFEVYDGIARFVKDLTPAYQFAKIRLNWQRLAGVICANDEPRVPPVDSLKVEDILSFIDLICSLLERSMCYIKHLVVSNMTRIFLLDTFYDPIQMAKFAMNKSLFGSNMSQKILPIMKEMMKNENYQDEFAVKLWNLTEFKKAKYDDFRVKVVQLSIKVSHLGVLFDTLLSFDSSTKDKVLNSNNDNTMHTTFRFSVLPKVIQSCIILMKILFAADDSSAHLLQQLIIIDLDLHDAENFFLVVDNKRVISEHVPQTYTSPEMVRSCGRWSFHIVFNVFARKLLSKYAIGKERQKLIVIDRVAKEPILEYFAPSVEALALDTIRLLIENGERHDDTQTASILEIILGEEHNQEWCHTFNNLNQRKRWAKDKSGKYSKMISRFHENVQNAGMEQHLSARKESVEFLLQKLQLSITKDRLVPSDLVASIARTRDPKELVEASKYLPKWEREDFHQIRFHFLRLLDLSEKATDLLRQATGGAYPKVKSILNENWKMRESKHLSTRELWSKEFRSSLTDVNYVNAILEKEFDRCKVQPSDRDTQPIQVSTSN